VPSFAFWLSFLIGFLSLSEEILWVRTVSFAYRTLPPTFTFVLVCYLLGIAAGAGIGTQICRRAQNLYGVAALVLALAALWDVTIPSFISRCMTQDDTLVGSLAFAIALTAAIKSMLFPVVHHIGSVAEGPRVGQSMSRIYFGNILGAALGPLLTGFLALDLLSVDECFGVAAVSCLLASVICVWKGRGPLPLVLASLAAAAICSLVALKWIVPGPGSFGQLAAGGTDSMTRYIANRHGVIHAALTPGGEEVFGGNVYDGIATTNVDTNPNRLDRVYLAALVRPAAAQVLFIGLSAGSWVRAMEGVPGVESIDVVEINPGYVALIQSYPQLSSLLADPRLSLHIDDGRRWLRRNPDRQFDVIVQNTTFHWRANIGNLLSAEYFAELKSHLRPRGLVAINATGSYDVLATAQSVFAQAYRYANFLYASDQPLIPDPSKLQAVTRPDGRPFRLEAAPAGSVAALLANPQLETVDDFIARHQARAAVITDDNLLTEYRDGERFGPALLRALAPPAAPEFTAN
jgi:spermidine synthase